MVKDSRILPQLTAPECLRYSRHLLLPEVGESGQRRLKAARVLVVGLGGLGSPASLYLAAAGVGTIGLVDFDCVDLSNLQRQILHSTQSVGKPKLGSAAERLSALNPECRLISHEERLSAANALTIIKSYDVILDGTDNFATRYLVNDACVFAGKPNVYGSIYRFEGQASVFALSDGPCYRCIFPEPPPPDAVPNCAEGGVLGVLAGIIGVIQATEALKIILGVGRVLSGKLLLYDALDMTFHSLSLERNQDCPLCGTRPTIKELTDITVSCEPAGRQEPAEPDEISAPELARLLRNKEPVTVVDVRNPEEYTLCHLDASVLIPLPELEGRLSEINPEAEIVVHCKSGVRSRKAAIMLAAHGFKRVKSLKGGILAWISEVDGSLRPY